MRFFSLAFLIAFFSFSARAQLGNLFSPGELSKAHAALGGVTGCSNCHAKGPPTEKCLKCHVEIKERLEKKKGYHGKYTEYKCGDCHREHKGKENDLAGLSKMKFRHDDTGWPLTGKHVSVECKSCHTQKRVDPTTRQEGEATTYLAADAKCVSCHKDVHDGKLGTDCRGCHDTQTWKIPSPIPTATGTP